MLRTYELSAEYLFELIPIRRIFLDLINNAIKGFRHFNVAGNGLCSFFEQRFELCVPMKFVLPGKVEKHRSITQSMGPIITVATIVLIGSKCRYLLVTG